MRAIFWLSQRARLGARDTDAPPRVLRRVRARRAHPMRLGRQLSYTGADVISKDGWAEELTCVAGVPSDYHGDGSAFILRMSVRRDHPAKSRVNSN